MRIRVSDVLDLLGAGVEVDQILRDYPDLEREDIYAALLWAARYVDHPRDELPLLLRQITPENLHGETVW